MSASQISGGAVVGYESPRASLTEYIAQEAESFAAQQGVQPEKLLILLTSLFLVGKVELNCSLLTLTPNYNVKSENDETPLYLEVLASNLKVVVISPRLPGGSASFLNFRHNLLLHIVLEEQPEPYDPVSVSTLFWSLNGTRRFICVDEFDHFLYWRVRVPMEYCSSTGTKWAVKKIFFKRKYTYLLPSVRFECFMMFNGSVMLTEYSMTGRVWRGENPNMNTGVLRFSISKKDTLRCFSYKQWQYTGITTLVKPFQEYIGISILLSILTVAKVVAWLGRRSFTRIAARMLLSLITVVDIDDRARKYSHLIASSSALALGFFVAQFYSNYIMFFFLNPQKLDEFCENKSDCDSLAACYSHRSLKTDLQQGRCLCNLNYLQQGLAKKPLHGATHPWRWKDYGRASYLRKYSEPKRRPRNWGHFPLTPTRVSSIIDRLRETAMVSSAQLKPKREEVRELLDYKPIQVIEKFSVKQADENAAKSTFIEFDTTIDRFDMERFRKIEPIFEICVLFSLVALSCELVWRKVRHRQMKRSTSTKPTVTKFLMGLG